jgi:hypothetical protein
VNPPWRILAFTPALDFTVLVVEKENPSIRTACDFSIMISPMDIFRFIDAGA